MHGVNGGPGADLQTDLGWPARDRLKIATELPIFRRISGCQPRIV
jgi:hypothetical protein